MPTLPWAPGRAAAQPTGAVVVLASRLELQSFWPIIGFVRAALAVRKQARESPGALGVSLIAQPTRKTFWTLSAWVDQPSLDAFVATPPHVAVMHRYHERMVDSAFTMWTVKTRDLPERRSNAKELWTAAKRRLASATREPRHVV